MKTTSELLATQFAELLARKTGLLANLNLIVNEIEERLAGENEEIDDEDEEAVSPSYGSETSTFCHLVYESEIEEPLASNVSNEQKNLLLMLAKSGDLIVAAVRSDDFRQQLTIDLFVPFVPYNAESARFTLRTVIETSIYDTSSPKIRGEIDGIDDADAQKRYLLYSCID